MGHIHDSMGRMGLAAVQWFCVKTNSLSNYAQFTVTVTAVVATMEPLEPATVTV
jgi:hypothetical protein